MEIKKHVVMVHLSDELHAELAGFPTFAELAHRAAEEQRRFNALPADEQRRILAEEAAQREAERDARTCKTCGCDPDEHGGY